MDSFWFVAHTRPRCEKKVASVASDEQLPCTLPLYRSVRQYRGKRIVFLKPLFPGYVFLKLRDSDVSRFRQNKYIANLLSVVDQPEFERQLADILTALESEIEVRLAPHIGPGARVRIRSGPLRGMEAWVEERNGMLEALLRLDFIGQAAAVRVNAEDLELLG